MKSIGYISTIISISTIVFAKRDTIDTVDENVVTGKFKSKYISFI